MDRLAWALAAAFGAVLLGIVFGPHRVGDVFTETDFYGAYGLGARALEHGHLDPSRYGVVGPVHEFALALAGFVVRDLFLAAELLSVAGAVAALVLWHRIVRERAGALAALLAVAFLAANAQFMRYGYAATTDALALALQAGSLALLLTGSLTTRRVFGAGLLAGLAFLTRYNAVALLPAGLLALLLGWAGSAEGRAPGGAPSGRAPRAAGSALLFAGAFLVPVVPWVGLSLGSGAHFQFQLHHNIAYDVFARAKGIPWDTYQRVLQPQFPTPWSVLARDPGAVFARMAFNVGDHLRLDALKLAGVPVALAAAAGLLFAWRDGSLARLRPVLLAASLLFLALVPAFHNERWSLAVLPAWATLAAVAFASPLLALAVAVGAGRRVWLKLLLAALPLALSARDSVAVQRRVFDQLPVEVLDAARQVRPLLAPGDKVLARKPHFAWHAGLEAVPFPYVDSLSQLAAVARSNHVRWLYFSWPEAEMRPGFAYLLDTTSAVPGLTVRAVTSHWPAVLYEIGPGFGRDPEWLDDPSMRELHRARAMVAISLVDWRSRMVVARDERAHGRYETAQVLLDEAARLAPRNPDVLLALGDNLLWSNRPAEAARVFDRLEALAPGDPRTRLGRGWAAALQHQDADAAELWRPVVSYANDAATLHGMNEIFTAAGDAATVALVRERMRALGVTP
jgi:hypothetical protein